MGRLLVLFLSLVSALSRRAHWVPNGTHCSYHQTRREVHIRCDNLSAGMFEQPRTRSDNMDILLYPSTRQKTKASLHGLYGVLADLGEISPYALRIRPPAIVCVLR